MFQEELEAECTKIEDILERENVEHEPSATVFWSERSRILPPEAGGM